MSQQTATAPRLWTRQGFVADEWRHVGDDDQPFDPEARVILPLVSWLAHHAAFSERPGVMIVPGEAIDSIVPHLDTVPLVALAFPAFGDGRSHSKAALLRSRHGYRGAIRATGDVLIDQIPLMLRNGFTEFEIANETAIRRLEAGRLGGIASYYQPAPSGAGDRGERYSWRRLPAA